MWVNSWLSEERASPTFEESIMTNDCFDIPPFLRRQKGQTRSLPAIETYDDMPEASQLPRKIALTASRKDRLAREVIAAVLQGHDTFGKLRQALGHEDRLLKAGIRHAKKWQSDLARSGSRNRPRHMRRQTRLEVNGRTYSVIISSK